MKDEEILDEAYELLDDFSRDYQSKISDVCWVTENDSDSDGDYCHDCIEKEVRKRRKEYLLEQQAFPIDKRDDEFTKFDWTYNYGGGYESESFSHCDECGKQLDISILVNEQEIDHWETNEISKEEHDAFELSQIFYSIKCWDGHELKDRVVELAKRAIKVFST